MRFLRYGFAAGLAVLAGAGPETKPAVPAGAVVVTIDNFRFSPAEVMVSAGTVVRWVNKDDVPHTATAKGREAAFDSGTLDTDDGFSFAFKKAGVFNYYCKVHPHMTGKVIVK